MCLSKWGYKAVLAVSFLGLFIGTGTFATELTMDEKVYEVNQIGVELEALEANEGLPLEYPTTKEEFAQVFLYMGMNNIKDYKVRLINARFDVATSNDYKAMIADGYRIASGKYPEYMAFVRGYTYSISSAGLGSDLNLKAKYDIYTPDQVKQMTDLFNIRAEGHLIRLKEEGKITEEMTEREKAKAIYEWIIWNTAYDQDKADLSHTGYGLMDSNFAVCEGYTAAFNLMCRMEGINIQGVVGEPKGNSELRTHIWSVAELDGHRLHTDATWGDPIGKSLPVDHINYDYFAIGGQQMAEDHSWDQNHYGQ